MSNKLKEYILSDNILDSFTRALGNENPAPYISSVLLLIKNSDNKALQNCTPESIVIAALRAATLKLSVDPAHKHAYLVPYGGKATLIVGYKGLIEMATRTGLYRYIHAAEHKPGMGVEIDPFTGKPALIIDDDLPGGWSASFEMLNGYSKTVFMSYQQIEEHKKKFAKGYDHKDSTWVTNPKAMQRKTLIRKLLQDWGTLGKGEKEALNAIENDDNVFEVIDLQAEIESKSIPATIRAWDDKGLQGAVEAGYIIDKDRAREVLAGSVVRGDAPPENVIFWLKQYRAGRDLDETQQLATMTSNTKYIKFLKEARNG